MGLLGKWKRLANFISHLSVWCQNNKLHVNEDKSNIIQFRTPSIPRTNFDFSCCEKMLDITHRYNLYITHRYNYLGLLFTEFLDLDVLASAVVRCKPRFRSSDL